MDAKELILKYLPLLKRNWLPLSLGILGMIFFAYGLIWSLLSSRITSDSISSEDIMFEQAEGGSKKQDLIVDVEGAVTNPGVYHLSPDARVQDALVASGGLSSVADRAYVSKNINLATRLSDGMKIYIPFLGEVKGVGTSTDGLININSASQKELEVLSGIGPVTASKIIDGRPYGAIQELVSKKIVGAKVFEDIKEKVTVY